MAWKNIRLDLDDRLAVLTVDRPEKRNALDLQTVNEFHEAIGEITRSTEIGAAIVTGSGEQAFVSGADIAELRKRRSAEALLAINSRLFQAIEECEKPIIAAVNGVAYGAGFELALACDIRICSERAKFALPEASLGIIPAAGAMYRLQRIVGLGVTKELVFTGNPLTAAQALALNLVSRITSSGDLMPAAREIAETIVSRAPLAIRLAKRCLNAMPEMSTRAAMELESFAQGILFESEDKQEGTAAFLEKRKAKFKGK